MLRADPDGGDADRGVGQLDDKELGAARVAAAGGVHLAGVGARVGGPRLSNLRSDTIKYIKG